MISAGIIALILILKFFNINIIVFVDPLAIIHRFFTLTFIPMLNKIFRPGYETAPFFISSGYILLIIIILSFFGERVWCKFVCPLGIIHRLISLPARYIRNVEKCSSCRKCADICPTNAINVIDPLKYDKTLCILCYKCTDQCPETTIFRFNILNKKENPASSSRRNFLKSILASFILFSFRYGKRKKPDEILRPPGATPESIQNNCLRCMECAKICPTRVIQPSGLINGLINLFTPEIRPDMGYCDYYCNLCGEICPNNAIQKLSVEKKQKWIIGKAKIIRNLCMPWKKGAQCRVCEEHCPIPEKAIKFIIITRYNKTLQAPIVIKDLCNGCGICENKCPVHEPAIKVYSIK